MRHCLTAIEHEHLSLGDGGGKTLSGHDVAVLLEVAQSRTGFFTAGLTSVKLSQYCGLIQLPGRALEILPKVGRDSDTAASRLRLLRLLRAAEDVSVSELDLASHDLERETLLDIFIAQLVASAMEVIKGGLLRRYVDQAEDLRVVRGAIDFKRQCSALSGRRDVVACRYDELSLDNPWNRALKCGLLTVRPWIRSLALYGRWREVMSYFEDVGSEALTAKTVRALPRNRLVRRYDSALRWVALVLSALTPTIRAGAESAPGLLFDMNRVFQDAVEKTLLRSVALSPGTTIHPQGDGTYLSRILGSSVKSHELLPDLILRRHGATKLIADVKWKVLDTNAQGHALPRSEDVYQMLSYAVAYDCRNLALIYPWHSGLEHSIETRFELPRMGGESAILSVVTLDVEHNLLSVRQGHSLKELAELLPHGAVIS